MDFKYYIGVWQVPKDIPRPAYLDLCDLWTYEELYGTDEMFVWKGTEDHRVGWPYLSEYFGEQSKDKFVIQWRVS